ncbi:MAG: isoprenylcysteine carboxylmethyltransferase family protein, partial [Bacteroidota bacterium]
LLVLGIAIVITVSGLWINIKKSADKSEKQADNQQDLGSLRLFRWAVPLALIGSLLLYFWQGSFLIDNSILFRLGLAFVLIGLLIRWYAVWQLGQAFTVQLQVSEEQELITRGIFKFIRHPSYLGLLLYYLGLGLVMGNLLCLLILLAFPAWAVFNRIALEESLLVSHFGEAYRLYQQRTWRLLPWVY